MRRTSIRVLGWITILAALVAAGGASWPKVP
jgi:hypothetical protein